MIDRLTYAGNGFGLVVDLMAKEVLFSEYEEGQDRSGKDRNLHGT